MKGALRISVLVPLIAVCALIAGTPVPIVSASAGQSNVRPAVDPVPGQYIVVLKDPMVDVHAVAAAVALQHGGIVGHVYEHALRGFSVRMSAAAAEALSRNPTVAWVEEDAVFQAIDTQEGATWGLDRVDQRYLPLDTRYTYDQVGAAVHAYIIDTGVRSTHNDFGGRAISGWDFVDNDPAADDCHGHGTHVAGTTGGSMYGIAKGVSLVAVRVLDCSGSGYTSNIIAGVNWVAANHVKPAVANMSLGGGVSDSMDLAVTNSIAAGVTYAVAAGNGNRGGIAQNACNYSPARVPEAITVSATDSTDRKASWANYGDCVDLFAPGVSITSAWYTGDSAIYTISGTSMASPHVAGAAALYLETNPLATPQAVRDAIYSASTKGIVTYSSTANNHLLYTLGFGTVEPPVNVPPVAAFTASTSGLTVAFADASTDSDGAIVSWNWDFGDGGTASVPSPSHTFAVGGTYSVTLTVTDDDGATGSRTQEVSVSEGSTEILLTVTGRLVRNKAYADLAWTGASGTYVDVYRNGTLITTTANDGFYTNNLNKLRGTFIYRVCEAGTSTCSNEASVTF